MAEMTFNADSYEIYQLYYYPNSNLCSSIEKLPTPDRVERDYSSEDNRETISAYWIIDDHIPIKLNIRQNECAKFVIRHENIRFKGTLPHYIVASYAYVRRYVTYDGLLEFSVTFECDTLPKAGNLTIATSISRYRANHQERNHNMIFECNKQPLIQAIYYNQPNTTVKWNDGTITTVGCSDKDSFDKEIGLAVAIAEKYLEMTGHAHPRAALKNLAEHGHDQTKKTKTRKQSKADKKKLDEKSYENAFAQLINALNQIQKNPDEKAYTFEQLANDLNQIRNNPNEEEV